MSEHRTAENHHIVPSRVFVLVWLALITLTAITVTVSRLHLGRFSTVTALAIASVKAGFVLWYFMHLKYESKLFKVLLLVPIATLTVIIGLTFFDIWYR
jgi:cytochrome c oxidase subunit 4